jgi:peptidyl-dipeptidase Dcp
MSLRDVSPPGRISPRHSSKAAPHSTNPLLEPWAGPYGGVPPFDRVRVEDFEPALEAAMAENLAEVEQIAGSVAAPDFDNTIAALERAGRTLDRVRAVYDVWAVNMSTPEFQAVERAMAPRLAAFKDRITQNEALFARIEAVYGSPRKASLTPEQQRLTWLYYTNFVRAGAKLEPAAKRRLSESNERLAALFTAFNQRILADETEHYLVLETEADLAGLPESMRAAAAAAAEAKGLPGRWVVTNTRSSMEPFLTCSDHRALRERGWRMWVGRGDAGDANDTKSLITEILALRAERAQLLGYPTHAHWRLEHTMAGTPERTLELMEAVWQRAVARVSEDVAELRAVTRAAGHDDDIAPWDYRYYAEQLRRERYDLDQNELKCYLQLDQLRDAMFWVGGELFGFAFAPVDGVPVYHADVRVWNVTERDTGRHVGLFYFDPYARTAKRSGAWMSAYRSQERFDGEIATLVSNNCNFVQARPGEAVLISWDDATTLFHEFGHALHGLASAVSYPLLSGTAVPRDYVEFPSQLLEQWLYTPEVLRRFALHYATGAALPTAVVERIARAATFNQGFATTEYLASALVDMKLHLAGSQHIDVEAFERDTLAALDMPRELVMRHRLPHFQHVFASDHYSAGYYSYLWSDVLAADAFGAFLEASGPYDRNVAQRLRRHVFSAGNTVDPAEAYRRFRGRDASVEALLQKRGLQTPPEFV